MMDFCRSSCIDIKNDNFSDDERYCLSNCTKKYVQQFDVLEKYKNNYLGKFGMDIFLFDNVQKRSMEKLIDLMIMNMNKS